MLEINVECREVVDSQAVDLGDVILVTREGTRRRGSRRWYIVNEPMCVNTSFDRSLL